MNKKRTILEHWIWTRLPNILKHSHPRKPFLNIEYGYYSMKFRFPLWSEGFNKKRTRNRTICMSTIKLSNTRQETTCKKSGGILHLQKELRWLIILYFDRSRRDQLYLCYLAFVLRKMGRTITHSKEKYIKPKDVKPIWIAKLLCCCCRNWQSKNIITTHIEPTDKLW